MSAPVDHAAIAVAKVRPWHQSAQARRLIASCVANPPVWDWTWLPTAHRETRDEYEPSSADLRIAELARIRTAAGMAIVSQGQTDAARRQFDRWQRDTVYAAVTAAQEPHAPCPIAAAVTEIYLTAGGKA